MSILYSRYAILITEKLKGDLFSPLDVLRMDVIVETFCPVDEEEESAFSSETVIKAVESIILCGELWRINPTCGIFITDGVFNYQRERLIEDIEENGYISDTKELDIHRKILEVTYRVEVILKNVKDLPDDIILKCASHTVVTSLGVISL